MKPITDSTYGTVAGACGNGHAGWRPLPWPAGCPLYLSTGNSLLKRDLRKIKMV